MESVESLTPTCKGKTRHGGARYGEWSGGRQDPNVPSTNVQVAPSGVFPSSVLIGFDLAEVGGHHVQGGVTHRQTKTDVTDHGGNDIAVVPRSGASVAWCIRLAAKCGCNRNDALLPCRAETFAAKSPTIGGLNAVGEDGFQRRIEGTGTGHVALPFQTKINGDGHVVGQPSHHQTKVNEKMAPAPFKHQRHAPTGDDLALEFIAERAVHLFFQTPLNAIDKAVGKRLPRRTFEGLGLRADHVVPNVGDKEEMSVVLLGDEGQDFASRSGCGQRADEIEGMLRPPFLAKNFRKVTLCHGLPSSLRRRWVVSMLFFESMKQRTRRIHPLRLLISVS